MKIKSSYQPGAGLGHVRRFSFSSRPVVVSTGVSIVLFYICLVVTGMSACSQLGLKGQERDRGRGAGWWKAGEGGKE